MTIITSNTMFRLEHRKTLLASWQTKAPNNLPLILRTKNSIHLSCKPMKELNRSLIIPADHHTLRSRTNRRGRVKKNKNMDMQTIQPHPYHAIPRTFLGHPVYSIKGCSQYPLLYHPTGQFD